MFIQTERTPNPAALKFIPGRRVLEKGGIEFRSEEEANPSPLARRIFGLGGVASVFLGEDFVSVTIDDADGWDTMKTLILSEMMQHFVSGLPAMESGFTEEERTAGEEDELALQIRELLETRVRPAVAADGGDISFVRFEDGIVYVRLRGACSGCPSATVTLKSGIENMLRHYVPEVLAVEEA